MIFKNINYMILPKINQMSIIWSYQAVFLAFSIMYVEYHDGDAARYQRTQCSTWHIVAFVKYYGLLGEMIIYLFDDWETF
jgi:hypothetical protein